jgi:hypothetical protein
VRGGRRRRLESRVAGCLSAPHGDLQPPGPPLLARLGRDAHAVRATHRSRWGEVDEVRQVAHFCHFRTNEVRFRALPNRRRLAILDACQVRRPFGLPRAPRRRRQGIDSFGFSLPALLGHELAGIVSEVGTDVRDFAVGDHVVGSNLGFCGHCNECLRARTYLCERTAETRRREGERPRVTRNGQALTDVFGTSAFAEYALLHQSHLVNVPHEVPFPQAAVLACGCITGAGAALNSARIRAGETIAIVGVGSVGLNVISGARLSGASRIFAIDIHSKKEPLARKLGATDFIDASALSARKITINERA